MVYSDFLARTTAIQSGTLLNIVTDTTAYSGVDLAELQQGEQNITVQEQSTIVSYNTPAPPTPDVITGSIVFTATGSPYSILTYAQSDTDFNLTTADFTIEWWQYMTSSANAPRIFSIGTYGSTIFFAFDVEAGNLLFWMYKLSGGYVDLGAVSFLNSWNHVAVVGTNGNTIKVYVNGTQLGSTITVPGNYNFSKNTNFTIGNESNPNNAACFQGRITNFRWVLGTAVYTAPFTPSKLNLSAIPGTKLLLLAKTAGTYITDSSLLSKTGTATGLSWSSSAPS